MRAEVAALQARRDRDLRAVLGVDKGVVRALRKFTERASGYGFRHRRGLLSEGIRLHKGMAPQVSAALAACRESLGFTGPVEVYVRPDPMYNAFCARSPSGLITVGLSSRLVDEFSPAELRFVIGHELGHVVFDHFGIPMPITAVIEDIGGTLVSRPTQLQLFVWCRAAEVSADRAGLVCARDREAGATAFFKMASGLATGAIQADLEAFASQIESLASAPSATTDERGEDETLDCFSTHPYTPVRVRALLAFARSDAYRAACGDGPGELPLGDVEEIVERDLGLMEPSYLEEPDAESKKLRRAMFCAGAVVAAAHGDIADAEVNALRALLGADDVPKPEAIAALRSELDTLLAELAGARLARRAQLVQHLTIIAAADGNVDQAEYDVMADVADKLAVPLVVIDQTLKAAAAPMD